MGTSWWLELGLINKGEAAMTLSNGDKALCAQIAGEIIEKVIKEHIKSCPHGRSILKLTCVSIGIALGSGLASGGAVYAILRTLL